MVSSGRRLCTCIYDSICIVFVLDGRSLPDVSVNGIVWLVFDGRQRNA